ncbi:HDOD domain-containing protein [Vogesella sp. LIG4]|uniref:HDOD domain-containing protein n=1 Tax=Vogesella sp. LIG4 TaxID=1192162 RepID=UPI0008201DEC|nr:HDOD domain-containing protein [Vogesella sp. LIG4]SCK25050.1 HDOD domain-containing protein [Vogesella sp. LIG4]
MELANWLSSLSENRWPVLADTAVQVRQMMARHQDELAFPELANLMLSDPFLLLDLLRMVGGSSALQRSESNPTVEQMLMLIGLESVQKRFGNVQALMVSRGKLDPEVIDALGLWLGKSRVAAFLIKDWLAMIGETRVQDCFIAALVYNLPACLYLIYRNREPQGPLLQEVSDVFGMDYPKLLEQFIQHLALPSGLLVTLGGGATSRRKQLLKLAIATANGIDQGWWRPQWHIGIEAAARLIGSTPEAAHEAVRDAILRVARNPRARGYTYPARAFLWREGPFPVAPSAQPVPTLSGAEQLEQALRESIRHFANDLKLERIFFLRYDQHSHTLRLRYQVGLDDHDPIRKLVVSLEPGCFFNLLASKPQSFHAPSGARTQLAHRYGDDFLSLLGEGAFAAMSVFTGHKLAGVFVVDNYRSNKPIEDDTYQRFKETVARVSQIVL